MEVSRRRFLKFLGGGVALAATGALSRPAVERKYKETFKTKELKKKINVLNEYIFEHFNMSISFEGNNEEWTVGQYSIEKEESLTIQLQLMEKLLQELYYYPKNFFFGRVSKIVIGKNVYDGEGSRVKGSYDILEKTLILAKPTLPNMSGPVGDEASNIANHYELLDASFKRTIHHELAHSYTTTIGNNVSVYVGKAKSFMAGILEQMGITDPDLVVKEHVSEYSKHNELEEVTETLTVMFTNPRYIKDAFHHSSYMIAKVNLLKSYLEEISKGKIDGQYWYDLEKGRINKDYFYKDIPTVEEYAHNRDKVASKN